MSKRSTRACDFCDEVLLPTDRRWDHVTQGGLQIETYCEDCMLGQVNDYAQRTIRGMLDGKVGVSINGQAVRVVGAKVVGKQAVKDEGTSP